MSTLLHVIQFIVDTLLTSFIGLLLLRFLLQMVRANFYNPLCQFVVKLTDPVLLPLRRLIPGFFGLDWACLILIFAFSLVNQCFMVWLSGVGMNSVMGLLILTFSEMLSITYYIYFFSLLALMFASWFSPQYPNPVLQPLGQLIHPLISRLRRFIKPIAGFDLSFFVLMLALLVINMGVIHPIKVAGWMLTGG